MRRNSQGGMAMTRTTKVHDAPRRAKHCPVAIVLLVVGAVFIALVQVLALSALFVRANSQQPASAITQLNEALVTNEAPATNDDSQKEQSHMDVKLATLFKEGSVRSVRLVGDSITAGYGTGGYMDHDIDRAGTVIYDDGHGDVHYESGHAATCWANEFRAYAQEHGVTDFVNAGINGAFMARLAQNPSAWLGNGADVVFVALGTNDAGYYNVDEFRQNATEGLGHAAAVCKQLVVLSPVSDYRPTSQLVEPATQLGEVLREICERQGYVFVDTSQALTFEQFCTDGLHPNSEGSLAIWRCIVTTLGL